MENITQTTAPSEVDLDPWLLAKDRYLAGLDDDERALFDKATIENIYYKTSNDARDERKRKTSSAIRKLQPLVAALNDYGEALDVYTNISPLPLAPIWGSIRILLVLAEKYDKYYNRIADVLGRIGDLLPRFNDYSRIFDLKKHARLRQALSETYFDIIALCMKFREILQSQTKVSLRRFSRPLLLDVQYDDALNQFRKHKKNVEKEAGTCHMIEAAESRALVLRSQELQELKKKAERRKILLSLLSGIDYESRHNKLRSIRHGSTGAWLKTEPAYEAWRECDGLSTLCCYGIPGCGKSVLTSGIIDALIAAKSRVIAYYFCDYVDKRTLDPVAILGAIVRQFLQYMESIPLTIEQLIEKNFGDDKIPDLNILRNILGLVIQLFPAATIVLDGIDEIDDGGQKLLYLTLNKLIQDAGPCLKLLISCRDDATNLLRTPADVSFRVHLQPSNIALDIEEYIRYTVGSLLASEELVIQDPTLREAMIETFLWVKFQLDDLCDAESDAEIKRVLIDLPKDLSETYARLLGRITGSQRQALAKRMFQWIICARRPLHVDELREGIAFTIDDDFFDREKLPTDMPRLIRSCGNLVAIDEDTQIVHLAHYTVQQYILLEGATSSNPCQTYHFTYDEANSIIWETCVAYLSFSDFETQVSKETNKPFLEMAVLHEATATGTTADMGRLGNTMRQALGFVNKNKTSSSIDLLKIDYQRLLPKRGPSSGILLNSYLLLRYAIDNWLSHMPKFSITPARTRQVLRALLVKNGLPFTFRPWDSSEDTGNLDYHLRLLGWALEHNHVPILKALPDGLPMNLTGKASRLLFLACTATEISDNMNYVPSTYITTLDSFACVRSFSGPVDGQLKWLYSKLVLACRQGSLDVIQYCLENLWWLHEEITFALNHVLFEAVVYGQLDVVRWMLTRRRSPSLSRTFFVKNFALTEDLEGSCGVLEVALFRGHPKIATLLISERFETRLTFTLLSSRMEDVLKNVTAVDTILEVLPSVTSNIVDGRILHLLHYMVLSHAARDADIVRTSQYIRDFDLEEAIEPGSYTPLSRAIAEENPALVRLLIEAGADYGAFSDQLLTLQSTEAKLEVLSAILEEAIPRATYGSVTFHAISRLLESCSPDVRERIDKIAYRSAIEHVKESESRSNKFFNYYGVVNPYTSRVTPLMTMISDFNPTLIKVLVAAKSIEKVNIDRAVWVSMLKKKIHGLRALAEVGADLATLGPGSLSTLEYAIKNKQLDVLRLLLQMSGAGNEIPCSNSWLEVAENQWGAGIIETRHIKIKVTQSAARESPERNISQKGTMEVALCPEKNSQTFCVSDLSPMRPF